MIKNIVFDMGKVLLAFEPQKYSHEVIPNADAAEAVLHELFLGPEWPMLDAGTITDEEAVKRVQSRIPQYAESVIRAMEHWDDMLTPLPGMSEILAALKEKGYRLYVLSNMSMRFPGIFENREIFQYFDGYVFSSAEKIVKPDPAIYRCLLNRFRLKAEECLFIDDLPRNIEGAVGVGMSGHPFTGAEELLHYFKSGNIL